MLVLCTASSAHAYRTRHDGSSARGMRWPLPSMRLDSSMRSAALRRAGPAFDSCFAFGSRRAQMRPTE